MKIAHYYPSALADGYGTAAAVRGWAKSMAQLGHDVVLIVDPERPTDHALEDVRVEPIPHEGGSVARRPRSTLPLKNQDLLVLHGGWRFDNVAASRMASNLGVPYVVTAHGVYHPEVLRRNRVRKTIWLVMLERRLWAASSGLHLFFQNETVSHRVIPESVPILHAPTGIDPAPAEWDGGTGGYLAWMGRYDMDNKGLDLLLQALALIPERDRPSVRMHGHASSGGRAQFEKVLSKSALEPWVKVNGPIRGDEKWEFICRAQGLVYPSRWEAFGMSVAEAVAAGVPTLVAPYPLGKFLAEHEASLLVDLDPSHIANGLLELVGSGEKWGRAGQKIAQSMLSWDVAARRLTDQLETLVSKN